MAINDDQILTILAIVVPILVAFAAGYVRRGRRTERLDTRVEHLVDVAEEGQREHRELRARITELEKKVAGLEALVRNGHGR